MFDRDRVILLKGKSKAEILRELVQAAAQYEAVENEEALYDAVAEREVQHSTAIGHGFAIPHARLDAIRGQVAIFGKSQTPIDFEASDGAPVSIFVLIAVAPDQHKEYLRNLARVARFLKDPKNRTAILAATDEEQLTEILRAI